MAATPHHRSTFTGPANRSPKISSGHGSFFLQNRERP